MGKTQHLLPSVLPERRKSCLMAVMHLAMEECVPIYLMCFECSFYPLKQFYIQLCQKSTVGQWNNIHKYCLIICKTMFDPFSERSNWGVGGVAKFCICCLSLEELLSTIQMRKGAFYLLPLTKSDGLAAWWSSCQYHYSGDSASLW